MTWTPTDEQARELGRVMEREMGSFLAHDPAFPDYFWTNQARAVLAAAGPMVAAQAWDEGRKHGHFERDCGRGAHIQIGSGNPYRQEAG